MLSKLKLKQKLTYGFVTVAMITAIVGYIGLHVVKEIGAVDLPSVIGLEELKASQQKVWVGERGLVNRRFAATPELRQAQYKYIEAAWKSADEAWKLYTSLPQSTEEAAVWKEFVPKWEDWKKLHENVVALSRERDNLVASGFSSSSKEIAIVDKKVYDASLAARESALPTIDMLEQLLATNKKSAALSRANSEKVIVFGIILGFLAAIGFGAVLSKSITIPMAKVTEAAEKISEGDVNQHIDYESQDEIGQLAESFRSLCNYMKGLSEAADAVKAGDLSVQVEAKSEKDILSKSFIGVVESIRSLISENVSVSDAIVTGKLQTRANADKFSGGYKDIVLGVNQIVESLANNIDAIPTPIQFIDRDFTVQYMNKSGADLMNMPQSQAIGMKCYDLFKTSKCKTGACPCQVSMDRNSSFTCENDCTINGKQMDIFCASAPIRDLQGKVIGAFEFVTDQTEVKNAGRASQKLAEFQAEEARKLTEGLEKLSKGNLDFSIQVAEGDSDTANAQQTFELITKAVNECVVAIRQLIDDTDKLVDAAIEGQLTVRADESKHNGDFKKIVKGVNNTLDAVITPINEAATVLDSIAAKDLTARVRGDYKGDYSKIKVALNTTVENLDNTIAQVAMAAEQISSASDEITSGSQSLAQGASEQASAIEEVSSSLQEMSSMTKQNAANAHEAKSLTDAARSSSMKGVDSMRRLSEAIDKIKASSDETAKIVKTIDEIAFQTNLLALNAAVEAARAGDAGKGFAVVAEEVRNLAMRSAEAAKNTADLIEGSVRNSEDGVLINQEVLNNLDEINEQVGRVSEVMAEIAAASNQQSQGIEQVNVAVTQMDQVTQQNAANSEESASAAEELASQAQEMSGMVDRFQLTNSGKSQGYTPRLAPVSPILPKKNGNTQKLVAVGSIGKKNGNGNGNGNGHSLDEDPRDVIPFDDDNDLGTLQEF